MRAGAPGRRRSGARCRRSGVRCRRSVVARRPDTPLRQGRWRVRGTSLFLPSVTDGDAEPVRTEALQTRYRLAARRVLPEPDTGVRRSPAARHSRRADQNSVPMPFLGEPASLVLPTDGGPRSAQGSRAAGSWRGSFCSASIARCFPSPEQREFRADFGWDVDRVRSIITSRAAVPESTNSPSASSPPANRFPESS